VVTTTEDLLVDNNYAARGQRQRARGRHRRAASMDGRITLREADRSILRVTPNTRGDISFADRRHIHPESPSPPKRD
jgi:hypothetical protein